jgi:hypothetical protein
VQNLRTTKRLCIYALTSPLGPGSRLIRRLGARRFGFWQLLACALALRMAYGIGQLGVGRIFQDDLPSISISRLRATGVITAETTEFVVRLGDVEQTVGVKARRFPNGGGWSSFVAPCCSRQVRVLKLLEGALVCCRCLPRRGVWPRTWPMSVRQRAEHRIPKLRAMLQSEQPLRLKPQRWGKMERRSRLEAALRQAELLVGYHDFAREDET